jgi:hypothetical protein
VGPPGLPTAAKRVALLDSSHAKEGHTMNADIWLELLIIVLRIVSAGLAG